MRVVIALRENPNKIKQGLVFHQSGSSLYLHPVKYNEKVLGQQLILAINNIEKSKMYLKIES